MGTEIIVALIGLAGGLLTAGLGFYQWRKSHPGGPRCGSIPMGGWNEERGTAPAVPL
ncbi:hypothetical protein [Nonomuraea endophytica]|uniref:Uncharacterized protein n=1 Tax=Nonomuraea endophytica TaxID=714136 RepID=A0A7W7ZWG5_9ACTN|nr:hypothetical protein [Nonomuraea endophytica]MBB5075082.1 hypothetical protein [Nonomuraea endophytica]